MTKIVATLGPATAKDQGLERLVEAGMDCARINCSHGTLEQWRTQASAVRRAAARAGRPVALMIDLQGPKLRLTAETRIRPLAAGERVMLTGVRPGERPPPGVAGVLFDDFATLVAASSEIVIGDGTPRLQVDAIDGQLVVAHVVSAGALAPRKGVHVTRSAPVLPAITEKDLLDLENAVALEPDFVALSFVRCAGDVLALRALLDQHGAHARVLAKIEKVEALEQLDAILDAADGIMIARGDYGVEAGIQHVPRMQKQALLRASEHGKLAITATQMLESMVTSPEPTRAEVADIANAILDGTAAVMLSAETSVGAYPAEAVRWMALTASAAEESTTIVRAERRTNGTTEAAMMRAAALLAGDVAAGAIVVVATTGGLARECARHRPSSPIVALVPEPSVAAGLALEWGVFPIVADRPRAGLDVVGFAVDRAAQALRLPFEAPVVVVTGIRGNDPVGNLPAIRVGSHTSHILEAELGHDVPATLPDDLPETVARSPTVWRR